MPTPNAPPEAAAARFHADVARLIGDPSAARFGLAVSGGADSLAMLLLAHAAMPGRIEVATVDHGLRPGSATETAAVSAICGTLDVPCAVLTLARHTQGNLQDWARRERYAALDAWQREQGLDWLMTAHHADDQVETLIMRLNRGSGVSGLAGIRPRLGATIRPLLDWRRAELAAIVAQVGLTPIDDPSNRDDAFDRARLRKALAQTDLFDAGAVARSARALADADAALEAIAAQCFRERVGEVAVLPITLDSGGLPDEVLRRVVRRCVTLVDPTAVLGWSALSRIPGLVPGERLSIGEALLTCAHAADDRSSCGPIYRIERAPPRRR